MILVAASTECRCPLPQPPPPGRHLAVDSCSYLTPLSPTGPCIRPPSTGNCSALLQGCLFHLSHSTLSLPVSQHPVLASQPEIQSTLTTTQQRSAQKRSKMAAAVAISAVFMVQGIILI